MMLFRTFLENEVDFFVENKIAVKFVGSLDRFSSHLQNLMKAAEEKTKEGKTKVFLATSYGGRLEILGAVKKLSREKSIDDIQKMTENDFEKFLWTADLPDPEIIIRTGGHHRLSNFLA
jgi:undecaprenyl diphosphate synthase